MKWVTTANVHFDRVASPWLIKRFIDKDAEFAFVPRGQVANLPTDAIPIAIPGTKLGPHDENGTTFEKLLKEYTLTDPALADMGKFVSAGVNYVLHGYRPPATDRLGQVAVGFLAFSDGMVLLESNDAKRLEASYHAYDALYAAIKGGKVKS